MRIKVFTRSMNYDLYQLAMKSLTLDLPRKRCTFTSTEGYFYYDVLKADADVVVNIDEDAFVSDNRRLQGLIEFVVSSGFVNCGMPDGGVVPTRVHNPLVTNPFFNILNVAEIRKRFSLSTVLREYSILRPHQYGGVPGGLARGTFAYDMFEPYYPFFLWLADNFRTLYLDARAHGDGISTVLLDHEGAPFLYHAWLSRFYGTDAAHTARILQLYREATGAPAVLSRDFGSTAVKFLDRTGGRVYYPLKRVMEKLHAMHARGRH